MLNICIGIRGQAYLLISNHSIAIGEKNEEGV